MLRCKDPGPSDNRSKKDGPTSAIRDYGADEDLPRNLVTDAPDNWLSISLPEPTSCTPSSIHPAVLPASASLGRQHRFGIDLLWHPFDATDEGHSDLSQDGEPSC